MPDIVQLANKSEYLRSIPFDTETPYHVRYQGAPIAGASPEDEPFRGPAAGKVASAALPASSPTAKASGTL
jgi:hypothetical protein